MARTTKTDLNNIARMLGRVTGREYHVGWAYGRPRLVENLPSGGEEDVSPRLPSGQLADWMQAYMKGFEEGEKQGARVQAGMSPREPKYPRGGWPSQAGGELYNPRPRRTRRRMGLLKQMRFFKAHGGGVVGEAAKGALDLARAEHEMERRGWVVTWEPDQDADLSWMSDEERQRDHEVWCAVLWDRDPSRMAGRGTKPQVLASLCGIVDPSREYSRVVEAELASEALARG